MSLRRGFTLIELLVVLVILVALAALIIPRVSGLGDQANTATTASTLGGINNAIGRYEAQFSKLPSAGDGVLDETRALYSKLHPNLKTTDITKPVLEARALTDDQVRSLVEAGIRGVHFQRSTWTGAPSDSGLDYQTLVNFGTGAVMPGASVGNFCFLKTYPNSSDFTSHNVQFPDKAFSINLYRAAINNDYVVIGLGKEMGTAGTVMSEIPVFQAANPQQYYARALCVFSVPKAGQAYFKAKYVGCFAPDGTCIQDNINSYHSSKDAAN